MMSWLLVIIRSRKANCIWFLLLVGLLRSTRTYYSNQRANKRRKARKGDELIQGRNIKIKIQVTNSYLKLAKLPTESVAHLDAALSARDLDLRWIELFLQVWKERSFLVFRKRRVAWTRNLIVSDKIWTCQKHQVWMMLTIKAWK